MGRPNKQHSEQLNIKLTKTEMEQLEAVNQQLTGGQWNKSDLGRFLINLALDKLATAKVETRTIITVDGLPVSEVK